jgi:hypothetical protein
VTNGKRTSENTYSTYFGEQGHEEGPGLLEIPVHSQGLQGILGQDILGDEKVG